MKEKFCCKCKIKKDINLFPKSSTSFDKHYCYCFDCSRINSKQYHNNHKKEDFEYSQKYWKEHREDLLAKAKVRKELNKERYLAKAREYKKNHRKEIREQRNLRYKNDLFYRIETNLRTRIKDALHDINKSARTIELIGCSIEFLKKYLESQFTEGMNWENYGYYGWHVDHIISCYKFDLSKPEEQKKCFHYLNLQPLWREDNQRKSKS